MDKRVFLVAGAAATLLSAAYWLSKRLHNSPQLLDSKCKDTKDTKDTKDIKLKPSTTLRILTVNDVYALEASEGIGGYVGLRTLLHEYRTPSSLFLINGDFLGGSLLAERFKGEPIIDIVNYLQTDLVVVGNHEFDFGHETLSSLIEKTKFPWLGANVKDRRTGKLLKGVQATYLHTIEVEGAPITIGFFGLCTVDTPKMAYPGPEVLFEEEIESALETVRSLQEQKCDVIVAVTHMSIIKDLKLAEKVPGIDLILGGHDHSPYQQTHKNTLIFKSGQNATWLGIIDLIFTRSADKKIQLAQSWSMIANKDITPDPGCVEIVTKHKKRLEEELKSQNLNEVVAVVDKHELISKTGSCRTQETSFPNLVADAMLRYYRQKEHPATLAVINGGFVRGDKAYPVGHNLTLGDIKEELPFPKPAFLIKISGENIVKALEEMLKNLPEAAGSFPHLSAPWKLRFDSSRPPLSRIESLTCNGEPVVLDKEYEVVITLFMFMGGDDCPSWTKGTKINSPDEETQINEIVIRHLQEMKRAGIPFTPAHEGRVIDLRPH